MITNNNDIARLADQIIRIFGSMRALSCLIFLFGVVNLIFF